MYPISILVASLGAAAFAFWESGGGGGSNSDQFKAVWRGFALFLALVPVVLVAEFLSDGLILILVIAEELAKFLVLRSGKNPIVAYATIVWFAVWELLIGKGLFVYAISPIHERIYLDQHFLAHATGSVAAVLMHIFTARLYYHIRSPLYYLILATSVHFAMNWSFGASEVNNVFVLSSLKVVALIALLIAFSKPVTRMLAK